MPETNNSLAILLTLLFDRLLLAGIPFALLRNYEALPEEVDNDVDIWVHKSHVDKFHKILFDCAISAGWGKVSHIPRFGFKADTFFFYEKPFNTLHIDCWHEIRWRNIKIVDDSVFSEHIQNYHNKFPVLSPGVEASISLLIDLLYKGRVKEKYKDKIMECCKKDKIGFLAALNSLYGKNVAHAILTAATAGNWIWLERKKAYMTFVLVLRSMLKRPLAQLSYWFVYAGYSAIQYMHPRTGLFVVLIGPDGSGKTTTANMMISSKIKRFFSRSLYYHGHFANLPALKQLLFWRNKKGNQTPAVSLNYMLNPLRAALYPIYYGIDCFLGHGRVWHARARYGLILFDRYFYDYLLQWQYSLCPKWIVRFFIKIIPEPDAIIYLKCAPEVIYERKPELSIAEIQHQQAVCDDLAKKLNNVFIVETANTRQETLDKIQIIISNCLKDRQK
jgi:thymidylate kinase